MNAAAATTLRLDGELTIYRAAELKPLLLDTLRGAAVLEIDLAGVTDIDSAGVQLLMLARRQALAQGRALRLIAPSAAVVDVLELLDLHACFGGDLAAPAQGVAA